MPDSHDPIPILVTISLDDELQDMIRDVSPRIEMLYHPARQVSDVPEESWAKAEILYTWNVIPEPERAPALRWVHVNSAGVDHVISQPLFESETIVLTNSSGIHTTNMAEYVFMMLLAFGHRMPTMLRYQREAAWATTEQRRDFVPQELRGSTIGIIGYGSIGREVARIAHLFGMEVLAAKRDVRQPVETDSYALPGTGDAEGAYFHRLYPPEALVTMVRACDFVVVTMPLTESTRGIVNADVINAMKPTAFLINVGRGGIVDEAAVLSALQNKRLAGYGSDVFASEPLPADSPFWKLPNVILSPHISGVTHDYNHKAVTLFTENLARYTGRKDLLNVVDRARGY